MKNIIRISIAGVLGATCATASALTAIEPADWWENQTVFAVNKEKARATHVPYSTTELLKADTRYYSHPWEESKSDLFQSLNGNWKFHFSEKPADRPLYFYKSDFDSSKWDVIPVPSCWEMQGYDTPMYVNVDHPYDKSQCPKIVKRWDNYGEYAENPVGSYLTEFNVPEAWDGKELFLNFEGIYSAAYVWVNGKFVGYTQAANTNHEFDVTAFCHSGKNALAVQVLKWSDGSYLEGQDMFRWGGIFRDVTLTAVPKAYVRDFYITWSTSQAESYVNGTMSVSLEVENRGSSAANVVAEVKLLDPSGATVAELPAKTIEHLVTNESQTVTTKVNLSNVKLWSCENPELYTVLVSLKESGRETEAFSTKYGFRYIEQVGRFVHINGQKVFFKGVNRQDTHPLTGRTMDMESQLADVKLMKQFNINTVRTSHCPHQPKMMAMYDHFGIYVMDEADLETHAIDWALVDDPTWKAAYVDREERMVLRDRNHPSVIFWSLGNESRNGSNFEACRKAIADLDDRMVHYEGQQADGFPNSDFTSKMYPYENDVVRMDNWDDQRPHFICEYAHSMGQSLGNFQDYWDYFENSKRTVGGCIWDWADQAIYHPKEIKNGTYKKGRWYTGYDFPGPHQGNFMSNGVVDPERNISQKLIEVKKVHQWIRIKSYNAKKGELTLENKYNFTNLSDFDLHWTLSRDGVTTASGTLAMPSVEPGMTAFIKPEVPKIEADDDAEYLLTLEFVTKKASDWADAGHVVASEQITLQERPALVDFNVSELDGTLVTTGNGPVTVSGKGFAYTFDSNGSLISIKVNGVELIHNGNGLTFDDFRWIENDSPYNGNPPKSFDPQRIPNKNLLCNYTDGDASGAKAVSIISVNEAGGVAKVVSSYTIYANGVIDVTNTYTAYTGNLNRLGMSMQLIPGLENVEYFARGPESNYVDRKTGSFAGIYNTTVTDMAEHFVKPQSSGNREELRYVKFTSPEDPEFGLMIETEGATSFSALHYTEEDLGSAKHDFELVPRDEIIVHLDRFQQGIGNGSCGSTIWARYQTPVNQPLSHILRITPLVSKSMGYSIPEGNSGAYLKSLTASDFEYKADKAPAELYQLIEPSLSVTAGGAATLNATVSENVKIAAWLDSDNDKHFAASEKLTVADGKITLNLPADFSHGSYRMRLVLDTAEPKADGPIASGRVYDVNVRVLTGTEAKIAEYVIPDGTMHADKMAYVKQITTEGATADINYKSTSAPKKVYTCLDQTVKATAGTTFTLNLEARTAGPRSTNVTYQDLRYNYAIIYADFNNSGEFQQIAQYGRGLNGANILGNYDEVMNISHPVSLPMNLPGGHARLRVIYQNAWRGLDGGANSQSILEGVAYDIPMEIAPYDGNEELSTLPGHIEGHPDGTVHPEGNAFVKRIVSSNALRNIDVKWETQPGFYTLLDEEIAARPGTEFTVRMVANRLGGTGKILQDLRYNHATIFVDWNGLGLYEYHSRFGDIMKDESINANYDKLMAFTAHIKVPSELRKSKAMIRVIYENAWCQEPGPYDQEITEGCAYDIPVSVEPKGTDSEITEITSDNAAEGIFDLHGRRLLRVTTPGIYIINGTKTAVR